MVTELRKRTGPFLLFALVLAALPILQVSAAGPQPYAVDRAAVESMHRIQAPHLPADAPAWVAQRQPWQLIDDFEAPSWPRAGTWVLVADLNGSTGGDYQWAPRDCEAAGGTKALWAVGGGADGTVLPCNSPYPDGAASSALLWLDLTALRTVSDVEMVFDIWADAAPNEGVFINYMVFDAVGNPVERRTVYSATGRASTWARGVRLDLTDLRDRLDPIWRLDGRGGHLLLEFVFVSVSGMSDGEGIFLDNLALEIVEPTPIIVPPDTPTPPPQVDRTVACTNEPDCGTLSVRAFVDTRCDGRYQGGIDSLVKSGNRVDVVAGAELLGGKLSRTGKISFRLAYSAGVQARFEVPDGYEMCATSSNPADLSASNFQPYGLAKLDFRIVRE